MEPIVESSKIHSHTKCVPIGFTYFTELWPSYILRINKSYWNLPRVLINISFFLLWRNIPQTRIQAAILLGFLDYIHLDIHAHLVGLLWTSDQSVAAVATYTTLNKHKRRIFMSSAGFESWEVLKRGAVEWWRRSVGPIVWEVEECYGETRRGGISYIE